MSPERDVFFRPGDLRDMGLGDIPSKALVAIDGDEYVRLRSVRGVTYEVDEEDAVLSVTAEPGLFKRHVSDLSYKSPVRAERVSADAAFINYSLHYNAGDDFSFSSLSVPWEAGVNINDFFAFSSFSYTKTDTGGRFVRLLTNVTRDDPGNLRRYIIGHFFANSGPLGGGGTFGGLSVSSRFSIRPFFVSSPGLDVSGVAATHSEVDVYVNDSLVKSVEVSPGEFELRNIMQLSGAGDSKVVIKDAFGREETVESSYYLSSALLKQGLHQYSYNIGFKRNDYGTDSFEYGGPAFLGKHDYGFTGALTVGWRGETDGETVNAGPSGRLIERSGHGMGQTKNP